MDKWDHKQFLVNVPMGVDRFDGRLIMGQIVVSGAMVKQLHEIIRRNSTEAKRHVVEVPFYPEIDGQRSKDLTNMVVESLRRRAADEALRDNRSIVSMSPVRWHRDGRMGMGLARMEFTTVPLTLWED